jgi:hypothetical protein
VSIYKHPSGEFTVDDYNHKANYFAISQEWAGDARDDIVFIRWQDWPALRDAVEREYAKRTERQEPPKP